MFGHRFSRSSLHDLPEGVCSMDGFTQTRAHRLRSSGTGLGVFFRRLHLFP
ncbi:hypothetical protein GWL_07330 [Herbaspirillum sp. GW103]|nr:hypothetical protein GWL_07330 [Herbaspirillum sp. GW103]